MATRNLRTILKKIYPNGDIDNIFFKTRAKDVVVSDSTGQTLADIADKVNKSADGATKVEDSSTNGNVKIDGTEVNVYTHPTSGVTAGTYNSVTVDANGHVTKGTSVTNWTGTVSGNASNATNTFTQATSRSNLTSGEKQSTTFGKIMKWFADLGSMAFVSNVGTSNLDSTLTTFYNSAITTDNVTKSTSITAEGWVADARAIASLQTQITTLNSNLSNYLPLNPGSNYPLTTNLYFNNMYGRINANENSCEFTALPGSSGYPQKTIIIHKENFKSDIAESLYFRHMTSSSSYTDYAIYGEHNFNSSIIKNALGFTPVQQGGGTGQGTNKVYIGWSSDASGVKCTVDTTNQGYLVTAASALTAGAAVIGNGGGKVTTRSITNNTSNTNVSGTNIPTCNTVNYHVRYWLNRSTRVIDADTSYTTYMGRGIALVTSAPSSLNNGCCAFVYS